MDEKFDELINKLNILKQNQNNTEGDISQVLDKFTAKKTALKATCNRLESLVTTLNEEIKQIEEDKKEIYACLSLEKKDEDIIKDEKETIHSYKKFYIRKSLLTILLQKPTYQAIYNIVFSFLVLYAMIFILNLYLGKVSFFFNTINLSMYFKGSCYFMLYNGIKLLLLVFLVIAINISGKHGVFIIPALIAFIIFLFRYGNIFKTVQLSPIVRIVHYWDSINFLLKILAYYFEKVLFISYHCYTNEKFIRRNIESNKTIVIKDNGDNHDIIFEFKPLNIIKELKNFFRFYYLPTIIYRDVYPTTHRNTKKMIGDLINCILCVGLILFILEVAIIPLLSNPSDFISVEKVTSMLITFILYSLMALFIIIFSFLHSFSNFTSEVFCFGDKYFYDDFFNSRTPRKFIKKISYFYEDFFFYYFVPLFRMFFTDISNPILKKILRDFISMLFLSIIFEYLIFSFIQTRSPIISICLIGYLICSYPINLIKTDEVYLVNWLIISLGIGLAALAIASEKIIIQNQMLNLNQLSLFDRIMPKVFYLMLHPDKLILSKP